jgi:23S rRNA (guanosine2251-2'-O)-methyltransferase
LQPVREAVRRRGPALREVLIEDRAAPKLEALARFAADQGVTHIRRVPRSELDRHARGVAHQGVAAFAPELELIALEALAGDPSLSAIALDAIQDPQNFGAVVRSAVALGGSSVLWGEHASAPLTPATFRASAGAIEHARLCRVTSLTGALETLRDGGTTVVGLDSRAPELLSEVDLTGPSVLVLGGEGEGLGRAVRRACTALASLGKTSGVESLNASVAAGIALYEMANQRVKKAT